MWKMTADEQSDEGETTALQRKDQTGTRAVSSSGPDDDDVLCSGCSHPTQPAVAKPMTHEYHHLLADG